MDDKETNTHIFNTTDMLEMNVLFAYKNIAKSLTVSDLISSSLMNVGFQPTLFQVYFHHKPMLSVCRIENYLFNTMLFTFFAQKALMHVTEQLNTNQLT